MFNHLRGLIALANKFFYVLNLFLAKRENQKKVERRKQVQDAPIDEFEKMFGPAVNADDVNELREPSNSEAVRSYSATVGLDKDN